MPLPSQSRPSLVAALALVAAAAMADTPRPPSVASAAAAESDALLVLDRLAYGPRPGDLARVAKMGAAAYVDEQLHPESIPLPDNLVRELSAIAARPETERELIAEFRQASRAAKAEGAEGRTEKRELTRHAALQAAEIRLLRAVESPRQLEETMVEFWFNHFNVFEGKGLDRVLVGTYERDSIRPYVMGRFRDLLRATAHDPAMLFYLDNWMSTAPGYEPPRRAGPLGKASGLNENYARELMELHTLGVDGGYTQDDVTELARMLTGWTIDPRRSGSASGFFFDDRRHDRGEKRWLGQRVSPAGQQEGEHALDVLASHPATARRVAFKLAQYFVADDPPEPLVATLAARFGETDGDIRALLGTLFASAEFRAQSGRATRFKTPYRFVVSAARAAGIPIRNVRPLLGALTQLGMPLFGCRTPDGYAVTEAAWLNQDALSNRVNFAAALASGRLPLGRSPDEGGAIRPAAGASRAESPPGPEADGRLDHEALIATLGSTLSEQTRSAVDRAVPGMRAALVLGSPDFMRY